MGHSTQRTLGEHSRIAPSSTTPTAAGAHIARLVLLYTTLIASCFPLIRVALIPLRYAEWWWNAKDLIAGSLPLIALHVALRWRANVNRLRRDTAIVLAVSALIILVAWLRAILLAPLIG